MANSSSMQNNSLTDTVLTIALIVSIVMALYFGMQRKGNLAELEAKTSQLPIISTYDTNGLDTDPATKNVSPNWKTLEDLITTDENMRAEKKRYELYLSNLQAPYHHFFQYILLPSLNIRKNRYTQNIDTTIVGPKFLEQNPYTKLALITKRSNFFRDVGDTSEFNEITNIVVNDIQSDGEYFRIPITLSFTAPNKRSFLLLVEKLSMTSNKKNISLINEFLYHLFEAIKDSKDDVLQNKVFPGAMSGNKQTERQIGYLLYQRIHNEDVEIIDKDIIATAIQKSAGCAKPDTQKCLYLFREKYRSIPYFAYTIADPGTDTPLALKTFLQNIPPLMEIRQFTFDQSRVAQITHKGNAYEGQISLDLIGKDISEEEVKEISKVLGYSCFQKEDTSMNVGSALKAVEDYIIQLSHLTAENAKKGQELKDLKELIEGRKKGFDGFTHYKKVIRMFEMYRMLYDSSVCKM